jgi:hypothetical protein
VWRLLLFTRSRSRLGRRLGLSIIWGRVLFGGIRGTWRVGPTIAIPAIACWLAVVFFYNNRSRASTVYTVRRRLLCMRLSTGAMAEGGISQNWAQGQAAYLW